MKRVQESKSRGHQSMLHSYLMIFERLGEGPEHVVTEGRACACSTPRRILLLFPLGLRRDLTKARRISGKLFPATHEARLGITFRESTSLS